MSRDPSNDDDALTRDSAPDLQILGDKITLQPRSYIETRPHGQGHGQGHGHDHEEALMKHMASFRSEPLQSVPIPSRHGSPSSLRHHEPLCHRATLPQNM